MKTTRILLLVTLALASFTGVAGAQTDAPPAPETATASDVTAPSTTYASTPSADLPPPPASETARQPSLSIGIKAGVYVPRLFNHLGVNGLYAIDVAYMLPFLDRRLALQLDAGYAPPGVSGGQSDPRIGSSGGDVTWSSRTHEIMISFGPVFRILPPSRKLVPYVGFQYRLYMLKTHATGSAGGNTFGANNEVSTQHGFVGTLGVEYKLGPGKLLFEVAMGWSKLPQVVTGPTSTGALSAQLGYRFFF